MLERLWVNWPLKVLSLSLAFAIWVFVSGEKRIVQDFSVPLDLRLAEHLAFVETPRSTVSVRLRGPESLVRRVDPVGMELAVDLDDLPLGSQNVPLSRSDLTGVPRGIDVDSIEPEVVRVELDSRLRRTLGLDVAFLGNPPDGFAFYSARVTPDRLTLEGPESQLRDLDLLRTEPVRLDQRTEPFVATVRVTPPHPSIRIVGQEPVRVRVDVDEAPVERTFADVNVEAVGQVYETTVLPARMDVTLSGPPKLLQKLMPRQLRLVVDVAGLTPFDQSRRLPVELDLIDVPLEETSRISLKSATRRDVDVWVSKRRLR